MAPISSTWWNISDWMRTGTNKEDRTKNTTRAKEPVIEPRRRHLIVAAALCMLTLAAYSNSFSAGFVFDNRGLLLEDPRIREVSADNLGLILHHTYWWPYGESGLYRPFATLSYLFNYAVLGNGEHPEGYHWINLLLHLGNVLLVYALARRLFSQFWPPVFVAALWAVHPVLTESVTNMIGRADLLAAIATLSGLLSYLRSTEAQGASRWLWLAALMAVTFVGVFSKESAVVILGVVVLYELVWWKERRKLRGVLLGCAAIAPPLLAMWYARSLVMAGTNRAQFPFVDNPMVAADFWTARLTALKVMARYLGLLVWPSRLSADYSYAEIPVAHGALSDWIAWISVASVVIAVLVLRRNRVLVFVAGFAALTFLPTSNLLFPIGSIMAERFLYLPAIALAMCVVMALYAVPTMRPRVAAVVLCLIAALFAIRTWVRNTDWHDDLSLARATVRTSPASYKGHTLLASALYDSHADVDSVIAEAEKSLAPLEHLPDSRNYAPPYQQAGLFYLTKGDALLTRDAEGRMITPAVARQAYERAREVLERCNSIVQANNLRENQARARGAPEIKPLRYADMYRLLSEAELRLGDVETAQVHAYHALDLSPFSAPMYLQLADVLVHSGRAEEGAVALMEGEMITSDPGLKEQMVRLYRSGLDPQGCAAVEKDGQWMLNPSCEVVHRHLCEGSIGAEQIYTQAGRADLAANTKELAVQKLGCGP
jgi:tetratricopeptide (TPR) repeat protein